jgi:hypothetical protein
VHFIGLYRITELEVVFLSHSWQIMVYHLKQGHACVPQHPLKSIPFNDPTIWQCLLWATDSIFK